MVYQKKKKITGIIFKYIKKDFEHLNDSVHPLILSMLFLLFHFAESV